MVNNKEMRPIFGYIGGKTWLKKELRDAVLRTIITTPKGNLNRYVEPFCGGLGAFINVYDLLIENGIKNVLLNDINQSLIVFYQVLNEHTEKLMDEYIKIDDKFDALIPEDVLKLDPKKDKPEVKKLLQKANDYYKMVKNDFNKKKQCSLEKDKIENSARLLFLQNHCFNNVYRENLKGEYNTPFNWDPKKRCQNLIRGRVFHLKGIFEKFDSVVLQYGDYNNVVFQNKDLIYCDPPYINLNGEENNYHKKGFIIRKDLMLNHN